MNALTTTQYRIHIAYRERSFERSLGGSPRVYHWTQWVAAQDSSSAKNRALAWFKALENSSGVSWIRDVIGINVKEERPDETTLDTPQHHTRHYLGARRADELRRRRTDNRAE